MLNCEGCPVLESCNRAAIERRTNEALANEQARVLEQQEVGMRLEAVVATEAAMNGQVAVSQAFAYEKLAAEIVANNEKVGGAYRCAERADFWRAEAERVESQAKATRSDCAGLSKLLANLGHLVGKQTCASRPTTYD